MGERAAVPAGGSGAPGTSGAPGASGAGASRAAGSRSAPAWVGVLLLVLAAASAGYEVVHLLSGVFRPLAQFSFLDLQVYRAGVHAYASGQPLYTQTYTDVRLPFTYPPFGVLALSFTALGGLHQAAEALSALDALLVLVIAVVCAWSGLRGGGASRVTTLAVGLFAGALALRLEPVTATVGFGQVNILLCAVVVLDVLVVPPRYRGILTGLATAVKLTPAAFVLYFLLTRRRAAAVRQVVAAVAVSLLSVAAAPGSSWRFWTSLVVSNRVGPAWYTSNQSLRGVVSRIFGPGHAATLSWAVLGLGAVVLGAWAIRRVDRSGARVLAFGVCGLLGLLVSPISWSHHWVWALPAVLGAVCDRVPWVVRVVGVALGAVLWIGPEWKMPYTADRELHWALWQHLVGNLNVWLALALVAVAAAGARSRPDDSRREGV